MVPLSLGWLLTYHCVCCDVTELDALFEQKRSVIAQFKAQEKDYHEYRQSVKLRQRHELQAKQHEKRLAYEKEL